MAEAEADLLKDCVYGCNISIMPLSNWQTGVAIMLYDNQMASYNDEACIIQIWTCDVYNLINNLI